MMPAPETIRMDTITTGSNNIAIGYHALTNWYEPNTWRWTRQGRGWRVEKVYVDADVLPRLDG